MSKKSKKINDATQGYNQDSDQPFGTYDDEIFEALEPMEEGVLPIMRIRADVTQPRRIVPREIRDAWAGEANGVPELLELWQEAVFDIDDVPVLDILTGNENPFDWGDSGDPIVDDFVKLLDLAAQINDVGLQQAIGVMALAGGDYQIIFGERRWMAFHALRYFLEGDEWDDIAAKVTKAGPFEVAKIQAAENMQRVELNAIERARQLAKLIILARQDTQKPTYDDWQALVVEGGCDRGWYAQVANGDRHSIPRGMGAIFEQTLGISTGQMRQYRKLLKLTDDREVNDAIWDIGDAHDWAEGFMRDIGKYVDAPTIREILATVTTVTVYPGNWGLDGSWGPKIEDALREALDAAKARQAAAPSRKQATPPPDPVPTSGEGEGYPTLKHVSQQMSERIRWLDQRAFDALYSRGDTWPDFHRQVQGAYGQQHIVLCYSAGDGWLAYGTDAARFAKTLATNNVEHLFQDFELAGFRCFVAEDRDFIETLTASGGHFVVYDCLKAHLGHVQMLWFHAMPATPPPDPLPTGGAGEVETLPQRDGWIGQRVKTRGGVVGTVADIEGQYLILDRDDRKPNHRAYVVDDITIISGGSGPEKARYPATSAEWVGRGVLVDGEPAVAVETVGADSVRVQLADGGRSEVSISQLELGDQDVALADYLDGDEETPPPDPLPINGEVEQYAGFDASKLMGKTVVLTTGTTGVVVEVKGQRIRVKASSGSLSYTTVSHIVEAVGAGQTPRLIFKSFEQITRIISQMALLYSNGDVERMALDEMLGLTHTQVALMEPDELRGMLEYYDAYIESACALVQELVHERLARLLEAADDSG